MTAKPCTSLILISMSSYDTVIIGAGAAGLGAAMDLASRGRQFLLLEASHRIGGRAYTEQVTPEMPFDLGAHWIMAPSVNPLMPLAASKGLTLDEENEHYTVARYFEDGGWLPEEASDEFGQFWEAQFEAIREAISGDDQLSVFDAIDTESRWAPYFNMFYAQDFTRDVDQASATDALAYVRQENDLAVASGMGNLLAEFGADVPVSLNSAVRGIDWSGKRVKLDTVKGSIEADNVIITVSTGVLGTREILFTPDLPDWKWRAINSLPLGNSTRTALLFDKPFLQDLPGSFTVQCDGDDPLDFRNRPFGYDYLEVSAGGRMSEWMEKSGERATVDYILGKLRHVAGSSAVGEPVRTIVSAWSGDQWTKGAYSCANPGAANQRNVLADSIDERLFFAGEATSSDFYASVHGAYLSGVRAAREV